MAIHHSRLTMRWCTAKPGLMPCLGQAYKSAPFLAPTGAAGVGQGSALVFDTVFLAPSSMTEIHVPPRAVRTLMGQSTLETSLTCLPTLLRYSKDPVRLVIHEDGTLTEQSRDTLRAAIAGVEFVSRALADEEVSERLKKHPRCRAARTANIMFLKMFDVALLEPAELAYCDSDILFLRPFTGLFGARDSRFGALFMADAKNAYAVRPWHLWPLGRLRLAARANAGLMRVASGVMDLDFVEWLIGRMSQSPVWARRSYWDEQTCWSALAQRAGCGLWDARRVVMASADMAVFTPDAVAVHFVATYRSHLHAYAKKSQAPTDPPVSIAACSAPRVGFFGQLISDFRGRAAR
jgi:hypothetical protein